LADVFEFTALEPPPFPAGAPGSDNHLAALGAEAERRGFDEGLARGLAEARAQAANALEAVATAERTLAEMRDQYLARAEAAAVDLAFQIAEKVIGATVAADSEAVLGVVSGALLRTTDRDHLVVEVHPEDFELVRDAASELAARLGGINRMEVISERRVAPGGCIVRTEEGEIDARIEAQIGRVRQLLDEVRSPDEHAPDGPDGA
jgi:flagellar assembly protein FliH